MELSMLLAQVMGLYLMLEGLLVLTRQKFVMNLINDLDKNRALMFVTGAMVTILGLLVVLNHNVWEASWMVVPTIIGWIMVVKGVMALFVPKVLLAKGKKIAKNRNMAVLLGLIAVGVGAYLAAQGFGILM